MLMRAISESLILLVPGERVSRPDGLLPVGEDGEVRAPTEGHGRSRHPLVLDEGARHGRVGRLPPQVREHLARRA